MYPNLGLYSASGGWVDPVLGLDELCTHAHLPPFFVAPFWSCISGERALLAASPRVRHPSDTYQARQPTPRPKQTGRG